MADLTLIVSSSGVVIRHLFRIADSGGMASGAGRYGRMIGRHWLGRYLACRGGRLRARPGRSSRLCRGARRLCWRGRLRRAAWCAGRFVTILALCVEASFVIRRTLGGTSHSGCMAGSTHRASSMVRGQWFGPAAGRGRRLSRLLGRLTRWRGRLGLRRVNLHGRGRAPDRRHGRRLGAGKKEYAEQ